jgi:hypothetical protein
VEANRKVELRLFTQPLHMRTYLQGFQSKIIAVQIPPLKVFPLVPLKAGGVQTRANPQGSVGWPGGSPKYIEYSDGCGGFIPMNPG